MIHPKADSRILPDESAALYHDRKRLANGLELILTTWTDQHRDPAPWTCRADADLEVENTTRRDWGSHARVSSKLE